MSAARVRLADELRGAIEAACRSDADAYELDAAADLAVEIARHLRAGDHYHPDHEDLDHRVLYSAGHGRANPLAPRAVDTTDDGKFASRLRLTAPYEGYAGIAHGGVTALLLDDVLGRFVRSIGRGGMTARLDLEFEHPVPVGRDILVRAHLHRIDGRKTWALGEIVAADAPTEVLARATGLFIVQRPPVI